MTEAAWGNPTLRPGPRADGDLADETRIACPGNQSRPYILVGHSLGGSVVRSSPAPTHENCWSRPGDPEDSRLTDLLKAKLEPEVWAAREKILSSDKLPPPIKREFDGMSEQELPEKSIPPLPAVPVVLLTGTKKNPDFPGNPIEQDLKLTFTISWQQKFQNRTRSVFPNRATISRTMPRRKSSGGRAGS